MDDIDEKEIIIQDTVISVSDLNDGEVILIQEEFEFEFEKYSTEILLSRETAIWLAQIILEKVANEDQETEKEA